MIEPPQSSDSTEARAVIRHRRRAIFAYASAAIASAIAAVVFLQLWKADLRVPFDYHGDALFFGMLVKSVVDGDWWLTNPHLGAPSVLVMHDFPMADSLHLLIVKVMSWFSSDWALLFNFYFLLGFPLITLSAFAVFRHFRVAYGPALASSLLFAFAPSRLLKGEAHLFLAVFYQVPLAMLVALWVSGNEPPLLNNRVPGESLGRVLLRRQSVTAIVICLVTATTGIYYAFFTGALILAGGVWASVVRRTHRNAISGLILTAIIIGGLAVQALPTILYHRSHGTNPQIAARSPSESEFYGMKVAQLLLPVSGHRLQVLRNITERYEPGLRTHVSEGGATSLGFVGSIGFLSLLGMMFWRPTRNGYRDGIFRRLAVLNLLALLLATTGGFGALFALLVTPNIRAYARMSVIIEFLALFAVALSIQRIGRSHKRLADALIPVLILFGFLDQVTSFAVQPYASTKAAYADNGRFIEHIERAVAPEAMIFELPYQQFPEAAQLPQRRLAPYDPLRPFLHSRSLRWSYPAMSNRLAEPWISNVSRQPPSDLIRIVSDAGFDGILMDRYGYGIEAAELQAAFSGLLGVQPKISPDDRLLFFNLNLFNVRAFSGLSRDERQQRRNRALNAVFPHWTAGFYLPEQTSSGPFRWCTESGEIQLENVSHVTRPMAITMKISAAQPPATLKIDGDLVSETVQLSPGGVSFARTLSIPPGRHRIRFHSDGAPADAPSDPRRLVWRVDNPVFEDLPSSAAETAPEGTR